MKSIVGKSVTVVLLLAVASGLAAWLVFGDKISAALSGEPQTVSPLTLPWSEDPCSRPSPALAR